MTAEYPGLLSLSQMQGITTAGTLPFATLGHTSADLTPAAVAADTSAEQTFTVAGLDVGDVVFVSGPSTAGIGIVGARVSAANTLAITYANSTAGSLTPAAGTYQIGVIR